MFDRFGEMSSSAEINETAVNLRKEGDFDSLKVLAEENGIYDPDVMEEFVAGDLLYLCDDMSAALGKLDIEAKNVKCAEIMEDWVEYIRSQCFDRKLKTDLVISFSGCTVADSNSTFFSCNLN